VTTYTTREDDIRRIANFIVNNWPGLEDTIPWGDDNAINLHPVRLAAYRVLGLSFSGNEDDR